MSEKECTVEPVPIPMLLSCPECGARHLDTGEFATKPHHTHACQACGACWRPAVVPTVGVQHLPGFKQKEEAPFPQEGDLASASVSSAVQWTIDRMNEVPTGSLPWWRFKCASTLLIWVRTVIGEPSIDDVDSIVMEINGVLRPDLEAIRTLLIREHQREQINVTLTRVQLQSIINRVHPHEADDAPSRVIIDSAIEHIKDLLSRPKR